MWTQRQLITSIERIGHALPVVSYRGTVIDGARRLALGAPRVEVYKPLDAAAWLAVTDPTKLHRLDKAARQELPDTYRQVANWREVTKRRVLRWAQRVLEGEEPDLDELRSLL